jgi:hypothetical protein
MIWGGGGGGEASPRKGFKEENCWHAEIEVSPVSDKTECIGLSPVSVNYKVESHY